MRCYYAGTDSSWKLTWVLAMALYSWKKCWVSQVVEIRVGEPLTIRLIGGRHAVESAGWSYHSQTLLWYHRSFGMSCGEEDLEEPASCSSWGSKQASRYSDPAIAENGSRWSEVVVAWLIVPMRDSIG